MENFLTDCLVCCEYLQDPQKLPCDHTFCGECLTKLRKGDLIKCPTCRQSCNYRSVKTDFKHAQFLELLKAKKPEKAGETSQTTTGEAKKTVVRDCPLCEENEAVHWCEKCQQIMCRTCAKVHEKLAKEHKNPPERGADDITAAAVVAEQLLQLQQLETKNSSESAERRQQRQQLQIECDVIEKHLEELNTKIGDLAVESAEQLKRADDALALLRSKKTEVLARIDEIFRAKEAEIVATQDKLGLDVKVENAALNYELVKAQMESIKQLNEKEPERALKALEEIKSELERKTQMAAYETATYTLEFNNDANLNESVTLDTKVSKHLADVTANDVRYSFFILTIACKN